MTGIIILAAGSSSRLGQPKQNLMYKGQTLLQHTLNAALGSGFQPMVLVLGALTETQIPIPGIPDLNVVHNQDWKTGMASSIRVGLQAMQKISPRITSVFFLLSDQPFIKAEILQAMHNIQPESSKGIVACSYQNALGAPVLFTRHYFPELLLLQGQEGAKKLLTLHQGEVHPFPFAQGAIDIDTIQDYEALKQSE